MARHAYFSGRDTRGRFISGFNPVTDTRERAEKARREAEAASKRRVPPPRENPSKKRARLARGSVPFAVDPFKEELHFEVSADFGGVEEFLEGLGDHIDYVIEEVADELADEVARLAETFAPAGSKDDPRTPHIKDSIYAYVERYGDETTVVVGSTARHARIQEEGGGPALMKGGTPVEAINKDGDPYMKYVSPPSFWWDKENKQWRPGPNIIKHPPTPAHPYLRPALDTVWETVSEKLRRKFEE